MPTITKQHPTLIELPSAEPGKLSVALEADQITMLQETDNPFVTAVIYVVSDMSPPIMVPVKGSFKTVLQLLSDYALSQEDWRWSNHLTAKIGEPLIPKPVNVELSAALSLSDQLKFVELYTPSNEEPTPFEGYAQEESGSNIVLA